MKAIVFIIAALAVLAPGPALAEDPGKLRVTLVEGEAYIQAEDSEEWFEASVNMPLREEDDLWVPEGGRLEVHVRGGAFVRLDEKTALEVLGPEEGPPGFYLEEGRIYLRNEGAGGEDMTVETPLASVLVPEEAVAMVEVPASGGARVSVLEGRAYAETRKGTTVVEAGTYLSTDDGLYATVARLPAADEWERWNRARDDDLSGPFASARYLPEELDEYAYDFDENGRWVYVREYGYVWTPAVSVTVGWAPYRHGRWRWVRGDYVWVSYERWGWVPYHYGRWTHVARIGWCWVPPRHRDVYWAPGYVAWIYTPTYVAWVPLAPGETYYARGYYGPRSVNILSINININKTVVKRVHRNVHIHNAVTVVHRDGFKRGKYAHVKLGRDFFRRKNGDWRVQGPPDMKPERHGARGVAKNIRRDRRPGGKLDGPALKRAERRRGPAVSKKPFELGPGSRDRLDARAGRPRPPEREVGRKAVKPRADSRFARADVRGRPPEREVGRKALKPRADSRFARADVRGRPPEREVGRKALKPRADSRFARADVRGRPPEREVGRKALRESVRSRAPASASRGKSSPRPEVKAKRPERRRELSTPDRLLRREGRTRDTARGRLDRGRFDSAGKLGAPREFDAPGKRLKRTEPRSVRRDSPSRPPGREAKAVAGPRTRDLKGQSPGRKTVSRGRASGPPSVGPPSPSVGKSSQGRVARGKQVERPKAQRREASRRSGKSYGEAVKKSLPGGSKRDNDARPSTRGRKGGLIW